MMIKLGCAAVLCAALGVGLRAAHDTIVPPVPTAPTADPVRSHDPGTDVVYVNGHPYFRETADALANTNAITARNWAAFKSGNPATIEQQANQSVDQMTGRPGAGKQWEMQELLTPNYGYNRGGAPFEGGPSN